MGEVGGDRRVGRRRAERPSVGVRAPLAVEVDVDVVAVVEGRELADPELVGEREDAVLGGADEGGAALGDLAVSDRAVERPAADPVSGLEDDHRAPRLLNPQRGRQPGEPAPRRRRRRRCGASEQRRLHRDALEHRPQPGGGRGAEKAAPADRVVCHGSLLPLVNWMKDDASPATACLPRGAEGAPGAADQLHGARALPPRPYGKGILSAFVKTRPVGTPRGSRSNSNACPREPAHGGAAGAENSRPRMAGPVGKAGGGRGGSPPLPWRESRPPPPSRPAPEGRFRPPPVCADTRHLSVHTGGTGGAPGVPGTSWGATEWRGWRRGRAAGPAQAGGGDPGVVIVPPRLRLMM